jgi:hypothetical protein
MTGHNPPVPDIFSQIAAAALRTCSIPRFHQSARSAAHSQPIIAISKVSGIQFVAAHVFDLTESELAHEARQLARPEK